MRILTKALLSTVVAGTVLMFPAQANQPAPITSTGSSYAQELKFLQDITGFRESILGTYEVVDCTTYPLPQQIACHAFDAVGPVISYVFFGTSS